MTNTTHLKVFTRQAKALGLKVTTYREGGNFSHILRIHDPATGKFWMLAPSQTGFYPSTARWFGVLANSKILSEQVLRHLGYKTIRSIVCESSELAQSELKRKISRLTKFPYIVKPEEGNKGRGIIIVKNARELTRAAKRLYAAGQQFMIQPIFYGTEYRVLIIAGKVHVAHTKEFPSVEADGVRTVRQLLATATTAVDANFVDAFLATHNLKPRSIPERGMKIPYHITRKGSTEYYCQRAGTIPKHIRIWGEQLAQDLSTKTVGVDVFIPDNPADISKATIIEINASPGFVYLAKRYRDSETVRDIATAVLREYFGTSRESRKNS